MKLVTLIAGAAALALACSGPALATNGGGPGGGHGQHSGHDGHDGAGHHGHDGHDGHNGYGDGNGHGRGHKGGDHGDHGKHHHEPKKVLTIPAPASHDGACGEADQTVDCVLDQ